MVYECVLCSIKQMPFSWDTTQNPPKCTMCGKTMTVVKENETKHNN